MNLITFSGPPSSGKTSVILKTLKHYQNQQKNLGVVKFDCLYSNDTDIYEKHNIKSRLGLSANQCPDHYFISNIEDVVAWGNKEKLDILITESAGLCNRCSPYIKDIKSICVIDNLSGINTPLKIGPMLKFADVIVITKGDIVSQGEREVFLMKIRSINKKAITLFVNGLTGQGSYELSKIIFDEEQNITSITNKQLRFPMPSALCSYCLGETKIGADHQLGNKKKIEL